MSHVHEPLPARLAASAALMLALFLPACGGGDPEDDALAATTEEADAARPDALSAAPDELLADSADTTAEPEADDKADAAAAVRTNRCSPEFLWRKGTTIRTRYDDGSGWTAQHLGTTRFAGRDALTLRLSYLPTRDFTSATAWVYLKPRTATGTTLEYGSKFRFTAESSGQSVTSVSTAVNVKPVVTREAVLRPGESFSVKRAAVDQTECSTVNGERSCTGPTRRYDPAYTTTFVGYETITVPAGTFRTCKISTRTRESNGTVVRDIEWPIVGYGIPARTQTGGQDPVEATSIRVNGKVLRRN